MYFIEAVTSQFEVRLEETFPTYIFTQIQMQYGILLATFKCNDGSVHCLVQGLQKLETADGQAVKNSYDCPLLELSRATFCTPSSNVRRVQCHLFMNAVIRVCFWSPQQWTTLKEKRSQSNPNCCSSMIGKIICIVIMFIAHSN